MKFFRYIPLVAIFLTLLSCEDVVDVDLDTAPPRLVVDASIDWVKGTDGTQQKIRLSKTAAYFNEVIPGASGATVFITANDGAVFNFIENAGSGDYFCSDFAPVIGQTYVLTVVYEGQTYTAEETLKPVPDIGTIEQDNEGGFFNDEIEVKFFFQDDAATEDYYLVKYDTEVLAFPEYETFSDEFSNGNLNFDQFSHEDLQSGQVLDIRFYGISRRHFEYMSRLLSVAGNGPSGPFGTPPATVRGNLRNLTDESNFALGYFRLSQVDVVVYTVE